MAKTVVATSSDVRLKMERREICLSGVTDLLFDRYPGDNQTKLEWWQKVYLRPGGSEIVMPTINITSFLSSHNTNSAPKRLRDKRKYKDIANACLSFVLIESFEDDGCIGILRDGKPIVLGTPEAGVDPTSGLALHRAVARLDKGIPNPKERARLPRPWEMRFVLSILPNKEIKEQEIRNLFDEGGMAIGLGTFRGMFGKFRIDEWKSV